MLAPRLTQEACKATTSANVISLSRAQSFAAGPLKDLLGLAAHLTALGKSGLPTVNKPLLKHFSALLRDLFTINARRIFIGVLTCFIFGGWQLPDASGMAPSHVFCDLFSAIRQCRHTHATCAPSLVPPK